MKLKTITETLQTTNNDPVNYEFQLNVIPIRKSEMPPIRRELSNYNTFIYEYRRICRFLPHVVTVIAATVVSVTVLEN